MNTAVLLLLICPLSPGAADPEESVFAGREALDQWYGGYPWYDAETDGVQRMELSEPWDWSWLWDWLPDFDLGGSWLQWLGWIVIVLALAGVAYLLLRAMSGRQWRGSAGWGDDAESSERDDADRIEALPLPVLHGRLDLLGEARRHYRQGNYGQAIIYLFSFQLVQLDKQQIIRLTKGKTNRQYMREVGPRNVLRQLVEQTMVAFEDVFFGHRTLDRDRFESCWSRLTEFESLATAGTG